MCGTGGGARERLGSRGGPASGARAVQVDLEGAGGVDPGRLERSLALQVRPVGRGRYRVWGGREPHWVDVYTRAMPRCDCGDHLWRERVCKHILAVLLREGDERVIGALAGLVAEMRARAREAERAARALERRARALAARRARASRPAGAGTRGPGAGVRAGGAARPARESGREDAAGPRPCDR